MVTKMSLTEEFNTLWSELNPKLAALAIEANTLRELPGVSSESEGISDLHGRLVRTRQAQDRLEAIVADIGRVRSRVRLMVSDAKDAYDDAKITAMQRNRIGEYTSAEERSLTLKAASFDEYRILKQAERKEAEVTEVFDYCQLKYKGLDSARRDIDTRIRLISLQSSLEG